MDVVAIIPAAGQASRLFGLPKYLLPIPEGYLLGLLCERLQAAGVDRIYVGANKSNQTLLAQYVPSWVHLYLSRSSTMTGTILAARQWIGADDICVLGMPDTYFSDELAFQKLIISAAQKSTTVAVGVWETAPEQRHKLGMCRFEQEHLVEVIDKPSTATDLTLAWGILGWRSGFWPLLHPEMPNPSPALTMAAQQGLPIHGVCIAGSYWDCGTPDEYWRLCQTFIAKQLP